MKNLLLKKFKPTTPSLRNFKSVKFPLLGSRKPIKSKTFFHSRRVGRNHKGQITISHRGGSHKKLYRSIDFQRTDGSNNLGIVEAIEYDPYRTSFLARIYNPYSYTRSRQRFYILAPKNIKVGSLIKSRTEAEIRLGHSLSLKQIPVGSLIHNLSTSIGKRGQYCRAAGTYAQLIQKGEAYALVRLVSGERRLVNSNCVATLGIVSNENFHLNSIGKAGRNRWKGVRPNVRGVAMNPIDHPHGGGEGKTSGGRPSVTPWGKPTKGPKTRKYQNPLILISGKNFNSYAQK